MRAVLAAGGFGTRLASVSGELPKPLVDVAGKPVIVRAVESLVSEGFRDIVVTLHHRASLVTEALGDGSGLGASIEYFIEERPLGSAGALLCMGSRLGEDFLLLNADSVFDVDLGALVERHHSRGALATILTHPNSHPYDSALVVADDEGLVTGWLAKGDERPRWYRNRVNAGIHVISQHALALAAKRLGTATRADLDRDVLRPLVVEGGLWCHESCEYVRDMGTPERYAAVCDDVAAGRAYARAAGEMRRAVFLDRDGTINRYVGFLSDIDDFELLPGVAGSVRAINRSGFLAVVVTNQPVVARGEATWGQLNLIHAKMETLLGESGAYLDGTYVCPHHPDGGYEGEVEELKCDCECRKPKPGMLITAACDMRIDLASSWMVGDSAIDVEAGRRAGCKTALVGVGEFGQDATVASLADFVSRVME